VFIHYVEISVDVSTCILDKTYVSLSLVLNGKLINMSQEINI